MESSINEKFYIWFSVLKEEMFELCHQTCLFCSKVCVQTCGPCELVGDMGWVSSTFLSPRVFLTHLMWCSGKRPT